MVPCGYFAKWKARMPCPGRSPHSLLAPGGLSAAPTSASRFADVAICMRLMIGPGRERWGERDRAVRGLSVVLTENREVWEMHDISLFQAWQLWLAGQRLD